MKAKKSPKKEIIVKSDKSFDEMIEDAFHDKVFKKDKGEMKNLMVLTTFVKPKKKVSKKKVTKKSK